MPVATEDVVFYKSTNGTSTGGAVSGVEIVSGVLNNLWPDVLEADRLAGIILIRKFFCSNEHATDAMVEPLFWISQTPTGLLYQLALGFNDADDDNSDVITMTAWSANAIASLASSAADTRVATIIGVNSAGVPNDEDVTLNGTTPVSSTTTWSKVWAVKLSAESASAVVTIKQGVGGTTRGTIPINREMTALWVTATSEATGLLLPDLAAGSSYGLWGRITVDAGDSPLKPGVGIITVKET